MTVQPAIKYVTACNSRFYLMARSLIVSLMRRTKVAESDIVVIVFGGKGEVRYLESVFRSEFPEVNVLCAEVEKTDFDFLREEIGLGLVVDFVDYLKAWSGKFFTPYIWLDSDILVNHPISQIQELARGATGPGLAPNLPLTTDHGGAKAFQVYQGMFRHCESAEAPMVGSLPARQQRINSGVIFCPRDFSGAWEKYSVELKKFWPRNSEGRPQIVRTYGQGIWQCLFWKYKGWVLPSEFNHLVQPQDSFVERQGYPVCHYIGGQKDLQFQDFGTAFLP